MDSEKRSYVLTAYPYEPNNDLLLKLPLLSNALLFAWQAASNLTAKTYGTISQATKKEQITLEVDVHMKKVLCQKKARSKWKKTAHLGLFFAICMLASSV